MIRIKMKKEPEERDYSNNRIERNCRNNDFHARLVSFFHKGYVNIKKYDRI